MKLCLKPAEYVESDRVNDLITSSDRSELRLYRDKLEDRLRQRQIKFKIVEPYYMENL